MGEVDDVLGRLRFREHIPEVMYLNKPGIDAMFVGSLGAITEFTREGTGNVMGTLGASLMIPGVAKANVEAGAGGGSQRSVTYGMEKPLAQALVLDAYATRAGLVRTPRDAKRRGEFVAASGHACYRWPDPPPPKEPVDPRHRSFCLRDDDPVLRELEQERAGQQQDAYEGAEYWLLTLQDPDGSVVAASVLDREWCQPNLVSSYRRDHLLSRAFGIPEKRVAGVLLISPRVVVLEPAAEL